MISKFARIGKTFEKMPQMSDLYEGIAKKYTYCEILVDFDSDKVSVSGPYEFKSYYEFEKSFAESVNKQGNYKSFAKKITDKTTPHKAFESIVSYMKKYDLDIVKRVLDLITTKFDTSELNNVDANFLVVRVIENGIKKFLGEYDEVYDAFLSKQSEELEEDRGLWYCSICHEYKEVNATSSVLKFDTLDKDGFRFKEYFDEGWKVNPICPSCRRYIKIGFDFSRKYLSFDFAGRVKYYIIPYIHLNDEELFREILSIFIYNEKSNDLHSSLISTEKEILYTLSKKQDTISLDIIFLHEEQSAIRILERIYEVYPSRLATMWKAKVEAEEFIKNEISPYYSGQILLRNVADLFDDHDRYKSAISELVRKIFLDEKISWDYYMSLVSDYVESCVGDFKSKSIGKKLFEDKITKVIGLTLFLQKLDLLASKKEESNMEYDEIQKAILNALEPFAKTDAEKFMLLLGAVTAKFGEEQLIEHKLPSNDTPPIFKSLKFLNYSYAVNTLFPSLVEKYMFFNKRNPSMLIAFETLAMLTTKPSKDAEKDNALFWIGTCLKNYVFSNLIKKIKEVNHE